MSAHICVPILSHHSLVTWPGAHLSRIDLLHNRLVISKVGPQLPCVLTSGSFHDRSGLLEILAPLTIGSQSLTAHSSHPGHSLLASFAAALLPSHMTNCPRAQSSALSALLTPNPRGDFIVSPTKRNFKWRHQFSQLLQPKSLESSLTYLSLPTSLSNNPVALTLIDPQWTTPAHP